MLRADQGSGLRGPLRILILCIAVISLCFGLMGCTDQPSLTEEELEAKVAELVKQQQPDSDTDLEQQVLEIIEQNPEAIVASVQAYQQERQREQAEARAQQQADVIAEVTQDIEALVGDSPRKGAETFELVLIEFSDFQCPFCARAVDTVERFIEDHGDEVMLVYKHLPLVNIHPEALPAAQAAWAAQQQDQFWEYHDLLFENQGQLGDEYYVEAAEELDLDIDQFNEDRSSPAAEEAVAADMDTARQLQIGGTPFFLLNNQALSGARPYEDFEAALEAAKAEL